jgi:hypothetical protein
MVRVFNAHGKVIAEIGTDPGSEGEHKRRAICSSCPGNWLNVKLECWYPQQKCATREEPWRFMVCPGNFWSSASPLQ